MAAVGCLENRISSVYSIPNYRKMGDFAVREMLLSVWAFVIAADSGGWMREEGRHRA